MTTGQGGSERRPRPDSESDPEPEAGPGSGGFWRAGAFTRAPLWARIVAPLALLALLVAIIVGLVFAFSSSGAAEPEDAAKSACDRAAEAQLERRGNSDVDVSAQAAVTQQADGGYRVQGTVTFDEDGETHHADVRCIVRMEGGSADVVSVRFND
jgi:hypothetical protein